MQDFCRRHCQNNFPYAENFCRAINSWPSRLIFCGRPPLSIFFVNMAVTWSKVLLNGIYSDNNRLSKKMVLLKVVAQKILFLTMFYSNWYEKICSTTFFTEAALWWILLWFIFSWAGWWLKPPNSLQITQIHKLWLLQLNMSLKASFLYLFNVWASTGDFSRQRKTRVVFHGRL